MARLQLKHLEKTYSSGFKAVHGINLDVQEGEFMVLVGPSGCAKSTTLRMIAGLEDVTRGEIHIGDRIVNSLEPGKRRIAMVFQNYALYPHMKVRTNLAFGLRIGGTSRAEAAKAVEEVARILEIEPLLDRLPKQLSGGQAQRVALGRALIKKPEVFLFDEPLSNLDAKLRASMRVRITDLHKRLKRDGRACTVVYVTHDQTEAMTMGDRICVMNAGHIMQVATPRELYENPANLFVAGFIGSPEMNLIDGHIEGGSFRTGGQVIQLDQALTSRLSALPDQAALGIRPQHMRLASDQDRGLSAKLHSVEFMGHEVYLHGLLDGRDVTCVASAADYDAMDRSMDRIGLLPDAANIHIFDRDSGRNVSLRAQG